MKPFPIFENFVNSSYNGDFAEFNFLIYSAIENRQLDHTKILFNFSLKNNIDIEFKELFYHIVDSGDLAHFDFFLILNHQYDFYTLDEEDFFIYIIESKNCDFIIRTMNECKTFNKLDLFHKFMEEYADRETQDWFSHYLSLQLLNKTLNHDLNSSNNYVHNNYSTQKLKI